MRVGAEKVTGGKRMGGEEVAGDKIGEDQSVVAG